MFKSGDQLVHGKYTVVRQLGEGSYGEVFLVEEKYTARLLAVKRLLDQTAKKAYFEEIKLLAKLERVPHVMPLLTPDEDESGALLIVSPYMDAGTLHDYIRENGKLSENEAVRVMLQVVEALDKAHAMDILHKDIKPENILGQKEEDGAITWYLGDWGMAELKKSTGTTKMACTLEYMAPELTEGKRYPASDIYSLGCTLFYMTAGNPPFTGSLGVTLESHRSKIPEIPPGISPAIGKLLSVMLEKDPAKRHDCKWLLAELENCTQGDTPTFWFGDVFSKKQESPVVDASPKEATQEMERDGRFVRQFSGVIADEKNGTEWALGPDCDTNWVEACAWASNLVLDGDGWRMPTHKELETLSLDTGDSKNLSRLFRTSGNYVWSGDSAISEQAWTYILGTGHGFFDSKERSHARRVFAVRYTPGADKTIALNPSMMETHTMRLDPDAAAQAVAPSPAPPEPPEETPKARQKPSQAPAPEPPDAMDPLAREPAHTHTDRNKALRTILVLTLLGLVVYIWWPTIELFTDAGMEAASPHLTGITDFFKGLFSK